MSKSNVRQRSAGIFTHEGAPAHRASLQPDNALRRAVLSCFLWEKEFYEDGEEIAQRIYRLAKERPATEVAALAREARGVFKLRHAPLVLLAALLETGKGSSIVSDAVADVIRRADEPGELLAIAMRLTGKSWKQVRTHQLWKGLRRALTRFDAYELAKYRANGDFRLRDLVFMTHPNPEMRQNGAEDIHRLVNKTHFPQYTKSAHAAVSPLNGVLGYASEFKPLEPADTWEVALSGGADKKEAFTRLLQEEKLGYLALLRNLRNMVQAGVEHDLIARALLARKGAHKVFPFRFIAAARAVPQLEPIIDLALQAQINEMAQFERETWLLVDVSLSMTEPLSEKSDLRRMDAAAALAAIWPGPKRMWTFSGNPGYSSLVEVAPRSGMAGVDAIINSQAPQNTYLRQALRDLDPPMSRRLVVITDEESHDLVPQPAQGSLAYMINVASSKHGVGYGLWSHVDGFSENVIAWIREHERELSIR
jgi:hypothetical protein